MTCAWDFDPPEFVYERWPVARKEHRCCECGRAITTGEIYQRVAGKWDGHLDVYVTCEKCADLRDSLIEAGWCPLYTGLYEEYKNYKIDTGRWNAE